MSWLISFDADNFLDADEFDTKEAAIKGGRRAFGGKRFYIGERGDDCVTPSFSGEDVIEQLRGKLGDEVGTEVAWEQFDCTREQERELGEAVDAAIAAWVIKHDLAPTCYPVQDVERIDEEERPEPEHDDAEATP